MKITGRQLPSPQRGAVLPAALVILLVLTVLGMLALSTAGIDVRLAANERDYQRALYAAEGGVAHMRALLHTKNTGNSWNFVFTDPEVSGGIDAILGGYSYRVTVYDRWDTDGDDNDNSDNDGRIMVCAEATSPLGTRASVEVMLQNGGSSSGEGGGYAQAGGGAEKSSAGDDTEAVPATVPVNLGGL